MNYTIIYSKAQHTKKIKDQKDRHKNRQLDYIHYKLQGMSRELYVNPCICNYLNIAIGLPWFLIRKGFPRKSCVSLFYIPMCLY